MMNHVYKERFPKVTASPRTWGMRVLVPPWQPGSTFSRTTSAPCGSMGRSWGCLGHWKLDKPVVSYPHKQAEVSEDFGGDFVVCRKLGPRWGLGVYVDI